MERLREVAEIHKEEAPEEIEARLIFVWFFVAAVILMSLIGSYLIINSLAEDMRNHPELRFRSEQDQRRVISGVRSLFGIVLACMGLIVCMLTVFDTYWEDRYFVVGIGLLMIFLGIGIFLWLSGAPGIIAGLMILGLSLIYALYVGILNAFGWLKLRKHKLSVFLSVVLLCLMFCLGVGIYIIRDPLVFIGA